MSFQLPPVSRPDGLAAPRPSPRPSAGASDTFPVIARAGADVFVPSDPPVEVQRAVDVAAKAAETLHSQGRQLHFEPGADSGRVRVEVRDMDGNVLRRLPLGDVFDVAQTGRA